MERKERAQGCLVGGAAGDALGYEVEFDQLTSIKKSFGAQGITEYVLHNGRALISDDTQMTLFTAEGLLFAENGNYTESIARAYKAWYLTQTHIVRMKENAPEYASELLDVPALFSRRAPGTTCMSAIRAGCNGTIGSPINHSKGCGGVMRVAPVGFLSVSSEMCALLGAQAAALTHGHDLGWLPGALMAYMVKLLADGADMHTAVKEGIPAIRWSFPAAKHIAAFTELMKMAVRLADSNVHTGDAIAQLGEGWVGDEALAIALFCALRFEDDFAGGIIAAVNHDGDSDSTGAIAGNLLGTRLGLSGIPERFREKLELYDLLLDMGQKISEL